MEHLLLFTSNDLFSPKPQTLPKCLSVSESLSENNSEDLTIKTSKDKKKIQHDLVTWQVLSWSTGWQSAFAASKIILSVSIMTTTNSQLRQIKKKTNLCIQEWFRKIDRKQKTMEVNSLSAEEVESMYNLRQWCEHSVSSGLKLYQNCRPECSDLYNCIWTRFHTMHWLKVL